MKRILIVAVLLAGCGQACAQGTGLWLWASAPGYVDPGYARANAEIARDNLARRCSWQQACIDNPPPERIKSMDEVQRDANEAWAYVRRLHPSW